jgi:hypothetical protein
VQEILTVQGYKHFTPNGVHFPAQQIRTEDRLQDYRIHITGAPNWSKLATIENQRSEGKESLMYTRFSISVVLLFVFAVLSMAQQPQTPPKTHLKVGDQAPDFSLRATDGKSYKLSDFKGKKNVVLAIYVLAFTGG